MKKLIKVIITIILFCLFIYVNHIAREVSITNTHVHNKYVRIMIGVTFLFLSSLALLYREFWVREIKYVVHLSSEKLEMWLKKQNWWPRILDIYILAMGFIFLCLSVYLISKGIFTF